jgi:ribosomal protein S18 acetylase RimI-like enzyme
MEIGPIRENELIDLAVLQKELINEEPNLDKMLECLTEILKDQNYYLLGARKAGRLVGSLVAIVCHDLFGDCIPFMIVENVIVNKNERQQGIGTKLMENVETIAKERGCRYIMLVSAAERTKARDFYHSLGYNSDNYRGFKKFIIR